MSHALSLHIAVRRAGELAGLVAASLTAIELHALARRAELPEELSLLAAVAVALLSKNAALLAPILVVARALPGRHAWRTVLTASWALGVSLWVSCDAWVRASTGNTLWFYAAHLTEPDALIYFGGVEDISAVLGSGVWAVFGVVALCVALPVTQRKANRPAGATATRAWLLAWASLCVAGPVIQLAVPRPEAFERLDAAMVGSWNLGFAARSRSVGNLEEQLNEVFAAEFPSAARAPAVSDIDLALPPNTPDILIVAADTLRGNMLRPDTMPKLHRLAEQGVRFDAMYTAGGSTQDGVYGMLHGRAAIFTPKDVSELQVVSWSDAMKRAGYELHFIQASEMWWRVGAVVQPRDFELHMVLGAAKTRDQRAALSARRLLGRSTPTFLFLLLVAPHSPYRHPPSYKSSSYKSMLPPNDPAAVARGHMPDTCRFGSADRRQNAKSAACRRFVKYYRSARYVDDVVSDLLAALDLSKTIVFFTGDHGESFGEDGGGWHGGRISDVQSRVPGILLGAGVPSGRIVEHPTSATDLMATVFSLLGVPADQIPVRGRSWLSPPGPDPTVWVARSSSAVEPRTYALVGATDRYKLRIVGKPRTLRYIGKMDAFGRPVTTPLEPGDTRVVDWLRTFLRRERGS